MFLSMLGCTEVVLTDLDPDSLVHSQDLARGGVLRVLRRTGRRRRRARRPVMHVHRHRWGRMVLCHGGSRGDEGSSLRRRCVVAVRYRFGPPCTSRRGGKRDGGFKRRSAASKVHGGDALLDRSGNAEAYGGGGWPSSDSVEVVGPEPRSRCRAPPKAGKLRQRACRNTKNVYRGSKRNTDGDDGGR